LLGIALAVIAPSSNCYSIFGSTDTVVVSESAGHIYFSVPPNAVAAATAESLNWTAPARYGQHLWSFGCPGYIPDTVLQDAGSSGGGYFMFTPEGMLCDNLGFSDNGGTGYGLGTNAFTHPTFIGSFANPVGTPEDAVHPKLWMQVTVGGVTGYVPIYQ
jgi:hypothetical protein